MMVLFFVVAWSLGLSAILLMSGGPSLGDATRLVRDSWPSAILLFVVLIPVLTFLRRRPSAKKTYALPLWGGMAGFFAAVFCP